MLIGTDGAEQTVLSIAQEFRSGFPVVNLTIEGHHTFAVGPDAVLVHNTAGCPRFNNHHSIPTEIRKRLPENLQNDPDIVGRPGLPNRRPVDATTHITDIHDKTGISPKKTGIYGGKYNLRFHQEIIKRAGSYEDVTKKQILEIRDDLMREFGI